MIVPRIAAAALFGLLFVRTPDQNGPPPCPPTKPDSATIAVSGIKPARLAGRYILTMVSTWPAREDTVATGAMDLWVDTVAAVPPAVTLPDTQRIPVPPYPRPSLIGATSAATWRLGALSRVRPDSREPNAPGLRLIDTSLVLGACPDQLFCEERHTTDLIITSVRRSRVRGYWALRPSAYPPAGVDTAGYPHGYFCAVRTGPPVVN
jgi:hypothetical protein